MIPTPYSGNEKYIFISYSHRDTGRVFPVIAELMANGYRVWFDQGIDPGTEWDENIADHIEHCGYFLAFMSKNYLASNNCKDELNYARDLEKERLIVYLEEVELPGGMAMRLNRIQSIFKYTYRSDADFYAKLFTANNIDLCLGDAPWKGEPERDEPSKHDDTPKYDPPKRNDTPKYDPPKRENPPKKTPDKQPPKPKAETKTSSLVMLVISAIMLVASFSMPFSGALFLLLAADIVLNIIAKPGLGHVALKILSQVVFYIAGFGVMMMLDQAFDMADVNSAPILVIVIAVTILLYYRPKWLTKIFKKK